MDSTASLNNNDGDKTSKEVNNNNEEPEVQTQESNDRGKRKQTQATASGSEVKRVLPTRSGVWGNYTRLDNNRDRCFCNYCRKEFSCPTASGTCNLKNHMNSCKQFKAWEDSQDPKKNQKVLNKEGHLQSGRVSEKVFREATNEMLVIGELPLAFVDSVAFKHFCDKVNLHPPHSRRTATRDIVKLGRPLLGNGF